MQQRLANFERDGLEGRRRGAQRRRAHGSRKNKMGNGASKPSRSSQKSKSFTASKSVSDLRDVGMPETLTEEEEL